MGVTCEAEHNRCTSWWKELVEGGLGNLLTDYPNEMHGTYFVKKGPFVFTRYSSVNRLCTETIADAVAIYMY